MDNLIGQQLGKFKVVGLLGRGGLATVYKAYQPGVERYVALKVLPRFYTADAGFLPHFFLATQAIARLEHPHIIPIYDFGEAEGYAYLALRLLEHGSLADVLSESRLQFAEARGVICEIGEALAYAHAQGIVHGDIKPSNVLIDERGHCLLGDFGLAPMLAGSVRLTGSGAVLGTPAYLSPEQCQAQPPLPQSDLYALGVMLYELVAGRVPFTAETPMAVMVQHVRAPLPLPHAFAPNLPEALERVVVKALAKRPADRYQTATQLTQALQNAVPEDFVEEPPAPPAPSPPRAEPFTSFIPSPSARRNDAPKLLTAILGWMLAGGLSEAVHVLGAGQPGAEVWAVGAGWLFGGLVTTAVLCWAGYARRLSQLLWLTVAFAVVGPLGVGLLSVAFSGFNTQLMLFSNATLGGLAMGWVIARTCRAPLQSLSWRTTWRLMVTWGVVSTLLMVALAVYYLRNVWVSFFVEMCLFAIMGFIGHTLTLFELSQANVKPPQTAAQKLRTLRRAVWAVIVWLASWAITAIVVTLLLIFQVHLWIVGAAGLLGLALGPWGVAEIIASFLRDLNSRIPEAATGLITFILTLSLVASEAIVITSVWLAALAAGYFSTWLGQAGPMLAAACVPLAACLVALLVTSVTPQVIPDWIDTAERRYRLTLVLLGWALVNFLPVWLYVGGQTILPALTVCAPLVALLGLALAAWNTNYQLAALAEVDALFILL